MTTGTTCRQFAGLDPASGEAGRDITSASYSVKDGKINQVSPGVFFYYTSFQAPGPGSFTVDIVQSETHPTFSTLFAVHQGQIRLFNGNCTSPTVQYSTSESPAGIAHVTITGASAGQTFIVSVKYNAGSLVGQNAPTSPTTVHYDFKTKIGAVVVAQDPDGLNLIKK
ncbi:MAG: hypothetical protein DMD33_02425 [Gemmatimonadetes bacterium]|nr:MAG: hypothetical protein DMD33_02425 [Gemmatimonadota bacterium]